MSRLAGLLSALSLTRREQFGNNLNCQNDGVSFHRATKAITKLISQNAGTRSICTKVYQELLEVGLNVSVTIATAARSRVVYAEFFKCREIHQGQKMRGC